jgi:hypothetical protein
VPSLSLPLRLPISLPAAAQLNDPTPVAGAPTTHLYDPSFLRLGPESWLLAGVEGLPLRPPTLLGRVDANGHVPDASKLEGPFWTVWLYGEEGGYAGTMEVEGATPQENMTLRLRTSRQGPVSFRDSSLVSRSTLS